MSVFFLDQEPFISLASRSAGLDVHEREIALEPLPFQTKLQIAFRQHRGCFFFRTRNVLAVDGYRRERLPSACVPNHYRPATVVAFGNGAFKIVIRNGMIFDLHGQTLIGRVKRGAFRNCP